MKRLPCRFARKIAGAATVSASGRLKDLGLSVFSGAGIWKIDKERAGDSSMEVWLLSKAPHRRIDVRLYP